VEDEHSRLTAVDLTEAKRRMDEVWDSQFDYSDHPHDGAAAPAEHRRVQPAAAG
jgi:hypothetical protein